MGTTTRADEMIRIGISGWRYKGWRGTFYPAGLAQRRELEYVGTRLKTVELNGSFYSLQRPESYRRWRAETPDGFVIAVKGSRFVTHMKKLRDVEVPLANFLASGVLLLGPKLGPFLWQFPEAWKFDADRFAAFLGLLPRTTGEAAALAEKHDDRMLGRSWTEAESEMPLRHAFEVRHPSCFCPEFADLLRKHDAALVLADTAGKWPYAEELTGSFFYARLHGAEELYASGYSDAQLDWWADRIRHWSAGAEPPDARRITDVAAEPRPRDVYVYFDNDAKVHAPFDAIRLAERLGV
jgi:uncharacterized protein YecE (DUF72 family)